MSYRTISFTGIALLVLLTPIAAADKKPALTSDVMQIFRSIRASTLVGELGSETIVSGPFTNKSFVEGTKGDMLRMFTLKDRVAGQKEIVDYVTQNLQAGLWRSSLVDSRSFKDGEQIEIDGTKVDIKDGFDYIAVREKRLDQRALQSLGEEIVLEIVDIRIRAYRSEAKKVEVEAVRVYPMPSEAEIREKVERLMKTLGEGATKNGMPNQRPEGTPGKSSPSNPSQPPGAPIH